MILQLTSFQTFCYPEHTLVYPPLAPLLQSSHVNVSPARTKAKLFQDKDGIRTILFPHRRSLCKYVPPKADELRSVENGLELRGAPGVPIHIGETVLRGVQFVAHLRLWGGSPFGALPEVVLDQLPVWTVLKVT